MEPRKEKQLPFRNLKSSEMEPRKGKKEKNAFLEI
jgi:hypothetical protein